MKVSDRLSSCRVACPVEVEPGFYRHAADVGSPLVIYYLLYHVLGTSRLESVWTGQQSLGISFLAVGSCKCRLDGCFISCLCLCRVAKSCICFGLEEFSLIYGSEIYRIYRAYG